MEIPCSAFNALIVSHLSRDVKCRTEKIITNLYCFEVGNMKTGPRVEVLETLTFGGLVDVDGRAFTLILSGRTALNHHIFRAIDWATLISESFHES